MLSVTLTIEPRGEGERPETGRVSGRSLSGARSGGLNFALTSADKPALPPDVATRPPGPAVTGLSAGLPLEVDLVGLAEPTAAHVIEAILHNSPRMRGQVETLMRQRAARHR